MSFLQSNDVARKAEIDAREKCFEVQISIFDNCSDHLPQDALQRSEDLVKVETNRCVEYEAKLNRELDQSQMKKMIIAMVDARLGALEASSAELLRVQSASLESLRELHLKANAPPTTPPKVGKGDRDRLITEIVKALE